MPTDSKPIAGPHVAAVLLFEPGAPKGVRHQLLSDEERLQLARISSIVRFKKGETIYERGDVTKAAFNVISGTVATYVKNSEGRDHVVAFLFPKDIFGLSAEGEYANSAKALSSVAAYRIPIAGLRRLMARDPALDLAVISKLCEGLRGAQRHAFLVSRARASSRIAMFLALIEHLQIERGEPSEEIYLPMNRSAVADFCGLTQSAVSRALRELTDGETIAFRDNRHLEIRNRAALEKLANGVD